MLNLIRNNVQSFSVQLIAGIVVVVMLTFGISAYRDQSVNTVVTIDDYEIKIDKYQRAYDQAQNEAREQYKERASEYMKMVNMPAQIVRQLTNNALVLKSATEKGLIITDKELAYNIYQNSAFQTDGRFDEKKYTSMLENNRLDKLLYEKDLREDLLTQKVLAFMDSGLLVSQKFLQSEYQRNFTKFEINVIEFTPELFKDEIQVSNKEISDYYELHKSEFQQKAQYGIKYFALSSNDVQKGVIVRDREIEKYYQRNKASEFSIKPSYRSRHILISASPDSKVEGLKSAEMLADKIYKQLQQNPGRFSELAKAHSKDPASAKQGGDLGWVEKGTFVAEFDQIVANLKKNEISKPFQTAFGFHIVELLDLKESQIKSLNSVKQEIVNKIRTRKAERRLKNKVAKLVQSVAQQSLEEIAKTENSNIQSSKPFDDASNLTELGPTFQLYQSLKLKKLNDKGHFELPGDKGTLIYEIEKIVDPYIKSLKDVRGEVANNVRTEKEQRLSNNKLTEYSSKIKTLKAFNKLALSLEVKPQTANFSFSDTYIKSLPVGESFRTEVFKMKEKQVRAINESGRGYLVYLASKKADEVNDLDNKITKNLAIQLRGYRANIILNAFINQMKSKVKVEYNDSLLKALNIRLNS